MRVPYILFLKREKASQDRTMYRLHEDKQLGIACYM